MPAGQGQAPRWCAGSCAPLRSRPHSGARWFVRRFPAATSTWSSGTTWPDGDPFLQRQNEPSVAASTRNPLHLLAGSNDYRTVDLPGLPDGEETGDAWLGLYKSLDGGQRWGSTLLPGYPQDPNRQSSFAAAGYGAAADPVVRAGTNGLFYYSGLVFNREDNGASAIFVARFIDNNNQEGGDPIGIWARRSPRRDPGRRAGSSTSRGWRWTSRGATPRPAASSRAAADPTRPAIVQNVPAGRVYVAYTSFTGEGATLRSRHHVHVVGRLRRPVEHAAAAEPNDDPSTRARPSRSSPTPASCPWRGGVSRRTGRRTDAIMVTQSTDQRPQVRCTPSRPAGCSRGHAITRIVDRLMEHRKMRKRREGRGARRIRPARRPRPISRSAPTPIRR